jgi:hypothetical protein
LTAAAEDVSCRQAAARLPASELFGPRQSGNEDKGPCLACTGLVHGLTGGLARAALPEEAIMTRDKAVKKAARDRAAGTGERYTRARRAVEAGYQAQLTSQTQIGGGSQDSAPEDQARWWRAYVLVENDRIDELRRHAEAGDDHARRRLASCLSDRRQIDEAITVIRPLADADDDIAQRWLARWLAERDDVDELRRRAGTGDSHALRHLAGWLADQGCLDELRELMSDHRELLVSSWESTDGQHQMEVLRLRADLGDDHARQVLVRWLARVRQRTQAGNEGRRGEAAARRRLLAVGVRPGLRECLRCHPPFGGRFEATSAE